MSFNSITNSIFKYICKIKALEYIKELFVGLPTYAQESVLDDLLQEYEVKGKVLDLA